MFTETTKIFVYSQVVCYFGQTLKKDYVSNRLVARA